MDARGGGVYAMTLRPLDKWPARLVAPLLSVPLALIPVSGEQPLLGSPVTQIGEHGDRSTCGRFHAPAWSQRIVMVAPEQAQQLPSIVAGAEPGTTILLKDGIYHIRKEPLLFSQPSVTLRSYSGKRSTVILDGGQYEAEAVVAIRAKEISIADLTIRHARRHPVHISGGGHDAMLYNLHVIDGGRQFIKVNPSSDGSLNDRGTLACSRLELTAAGRAYVEANPAGGLRCYTGGIDAHQAWGWVVRDNAFEGFYCLNGGLAEHAIHFWVFGDSCG